MGSGFLGLVVRFKALDQGAMGKIAQLSKKLDGIANANKTAGQESEKGGKKQVEAYKKISAAAKVYLGAAITTWVVYDNIISDATSNMAGMTTSMRRQFEQQYRHITTHTMLSARELGKLQTSLKEVGFSGEQIGAMTPGAAKFSANMGVSGGQTGQMALTAMRGLGVTQRDPAKQAAEMQRVFDTIAAGSQSANFNTRALAQSLKNESDPTRFALRFSALSSSVGDVDGALEELNNKRMATASGQWHSFKNSVFQLAGAIGKTLMPIIIMVVKPLTALMGVVAKYPLLRALATAVLVGAAALGVYSAVVITQAIPASIAFTVALATNPVFLIASAIALLVFGIVALVKKWKTMSDTAKGFVVAVFPIIGVIALIRKAWQKWGDGIVDFVKKWAVLTSPITLTIKAVQALTNKFEALKKAKDAVVGGAKKVGGAIKGGLSKAGNFLGFAKGGHVERSGLAMIHSGETIVPNHASVRSLHQGPAAGSGGGGITVNFPNATILARNEAEAKASGASFARALLTALEAGGTA